MFDDNVWDKFYDNDDLIVRHSGSQYNNQLVIEGDGCKKSLHELHGLKSRGCVSSYDTLGKDELCLQNLNRNERMRENNSWPDTPEGVFSSCNGDSDSKAKELTLDQTGMSDFCFKNGNIDSGGSELCEEKCVVEVDNELSFLDNDGWLDIGNLEDVDRMLSCDLTFGMGSLNNEEEFCWFSSSHTTEGSDDALMSDLKLPCADTSPLKNISECNMDSSKDNIEVPLMNLDFIHAPNLTSISSTFSEPRAEHDVHMTPSLIESSYASNMECSRRHSLVAASLKTNENREKYRSHGHLSSRSFKNERRANEMQFHSPGSSQQVAHQFENENEGHSKVRGVSLGFSSEAYSSNVQESSPISSGLDENSIHASSFGHLQQLLEQLDIRTKLCIRDSLYRLAKSAVQRLNNSNSNCCIGDGTGACKDTMAQDASRPTDSSTLLQNDVTPFQSSATIHESTINPPVKAEKQVCHEGSSIDVEKNLVGGNA